eukprot:m.182871 g.182871  ORF g.182871 m.182871 type:complete len:65 (+) comp39296_c0_seq3:781-975(+)
MSDSLEIVLSCQSYQQQYSAVLKKSSLNRTADAFGNARNKQLRTDEFWGTDLQLTFPPSPVNKQ